MGIVYGGFECVVILVRVGGDFLIVVGLIFW